MKEAFIHLVKNDNQGRDLTDLNQSYLTLIAQTFGGFTVTEARGGWINPDGKLYDEPVLRVSIAMADTKETNEKLKQIATAYKALANQEAVYTVDTKGDVYFI
jgi:Protein of unknown function (DUF3574)